MKFLILSIFFFCFSCSHITPKGKKVVIWEDLSSDLVNVLEEVGRVNCRNEIFFVSRSTNTRLCRERLRNSASEINGELVIIDKTVILDSFLSTGVEMSGTAYKKPPELDDSQLEGRKK